MLRTDVSSPLEYIPNPLRAAIHQLAMAKQADVSDPVRRHIADAQEMAVVYAVREHVLDEVWDSLD